MSFREANQVQYNAGLEETNNTQFDLDTNPIRNNERSRAGSFSAKTNTAQPMALWKSLPVTKGDKVNINVWANYTQPSTSINNIFNFTPFFLNLGQNAGSFLEGNSPVRLEAGFNLAGFFVPNTNTSTNLPKSYTMYRFYDKNGVLLSRDFRLLSSVANGNWENLQIPTFEANTNGNLEVFVFNESNVNVWFDDIQIQHIPTLISQENHYYAFGMNAKEIEKEGNVNNRFQYNSKEKESFQALEWNDYGARSYDSEVSRWWGVDAKADEMRRFSVYNYCFNNPIRFVDPDGNKGQSTHTDKNGKVLAVYDDGDLGVYKHDNAKTKEDIEKSYSKTNTSAGGKKMGETMFWDEFINPDNNKIYGGKIQFGKSWNPIIDRIRKQADNMGLIDIASASRGGGKFDIKTGYEYGAGALLNGKYVTVRSAGNYLAALNAAKANGIFGGYQASASIGITFDMFMRIAGALHVAESNQQKLSFGGKVNVILLGATYGPKPAYGENEYCYRMCDYGWRNAGTNRTGPIPTADEFINEYNNDKERYGYFKD